MIPIEAQMLKCLYSCVPMMQQQGGGGSGGGGGGGGGGAGGSGGDHGGKKKRRGRRRGEGQATAECATDAGAEGGAAEGVAGAEGGAEGVAGAKGGAEGVAGVGTAIAVEGGADAARQVAADAVRRALTGAAVESAAGMAVVGSDAEAVEGGAEAVECGMGGTSWVAVVAEVEEIEDEQIRGEQILDGQTAGYQVMEGQAEGVSFVVVEEGAWQAKERQADEGHANGEQTLEGQAEGDLFVVAEEGAWQAVWEPLSHGVYFCNAAAAITQWHPPDHGEGSGLACWVGWTPAQAVAEEAVSAEGAPTQAEVEQVLLEPAVAEAEAVADRSVEEEAAIAAHHAAMCAAVMDCDDATCAGGDAATSAGGGGAGASAGANCAEDRAATYAPATCGDHTAPLSSEEEVLEQRGVRVKAGEEEVEDGRVGEVNSECEGMGRQGGEEELRGGSLDEGRCECVAGTRGAADVGGAKDLVGGAGVVVDAFCGVGGNTIHLAKL
ncbi:unnamed protein product [Closterium sp. Naga37s-1]|nr:unnamed protein product [Closterium sp. Naga37s-1]